MDTTTSLAATGVVVALGRWSQEKEIPFSMFLGFGILAVFLTVFQSSNAKFAQQLGTMVLVGSVVLYGSAIVGKLGYAEKNVIRPNQRNTIRPIR